MTSFNSFKEAISRGRCVFICSFVCLLALQVRAGGYVTDDVYRCSTEKAQFDLSIGATSEISLHGSTLGICKGQAYVSGGNAHDCYGAAQVHSDSSCSKNVALSWIGCFSPKKVFTMKLRYAYGDETTYSCVRTVRGGAYDMDGSRH